MHFVNIFNILHSQQTRTQSSIIYILKGEKICICILSWLKYKDYQEKYSVHTDKTFMHLMSISFIVLVKQANILLTDTHTIQIFKLKTDTFDFILNSKPNFEHFKCLK
jgi:hypothetical protein